MEEFYRLKIGARLYVATIVLSGLAIVSYSLYEISVHSIGSDWFVLALLTILTGSFTVKIPSINAHLSVSETFVFVSVLLFGPEAGAITVLIECLVILLWMDPDGRPAHRVLFNLAAPPIAIWASGQVFYLIADTVPYSAHAGELPQLSDLFLPLASFTVLYFLLNSWLVAFAVGLENNSSPSHIWWHNFTWLSTNYFSGASVSALIVTHTRELDLSIFAIILPLLVVSYLTFRTAMARLEDSNRHLSELNKLHLSTVETLAMAIDAKDQITHGHIRRVQAYAVGLARRLGVADERLIKGIEAAALLHDMGKLAVPEYILNKPGKLTDAEFEKMKMHASVGADILSAIEFPYPVVPIVRHHHENWDGTGYPAGLKKTEIPIGARILAVVDCYDALTSDRPYRPRLSDEDALQILKDRRGSMYDPLVVDTFLQVHNEIGPAVAPNRLPRYGLDEITGSGQEASYSYKRGLDNDVLDLATRLEIDKLVTHLSGVTNTKDAGEELTRVLNRLIPFSVSILYLYDSTNDELRAIHIAGNGASLAASCRVQLGHGITGWVAAHRYTIVNSDSRLESENAASPQHLECCLSTPLLNEDELVGVLTLYAPSKQAFTNSHRNVVEGLAKLVAPSFARMKSKAITRALSH